MRNQRGQGLVEYLILLCLIAVSSIAVVTVVGTNIKEQYAKVSQGLRNGSDHISLSSPGKETFRKRGMDDYLENTR